VSRYEWFQTDDFVNISIFKKQLKPEQVQVVPTAENLTVCIQLTDDNNNRNWTLDLDLCEQIIPEESKHSVLSTKVEVKLKKRTRGSKWNTLERQVDCTNNNNNNNGKIAGGQSTGGRKEKNWDKIVNSSVEEEKPEGEQAVNALFQQIYANGNEEIKRAMMKSFVERYKIEYFPYFQIILI
jgi:suppressor of G2 allele of SKP1